MLGVCRQITVDMAIGYITGDMAIRRTRKSAVEMVVIPVDVVKSGTGIGTVIVDMAVGKRGAAFHKVDMAWDIRAFGTQPLHIMLMIIIKSCRVYIFMSMHGVYLLDTFYVNNI
jgi:hypothetical protein